MEANATSALQDRINYYLQKMYGVAAAPANPFAAIPALTASDTPQIPAQQSTANNLGNAVGNLSGKYLGNQVVGSIGSELGGGASGIEGGAAGLGDLGAGTSAYSSGMTTALDSQLAGPTLEQAGAQGLLGSGGASIPGIAAGAYVGLKSLQGIKGAIKGHDLSLQQQLALALPTFGASLLYNPVRKWLGFGGPSPHESQANITSNLLSQSPENSAWQNYVQGMRSQYSAPPPDLSKPFDGKYGTWDEYKNAGLDASDLTGVAGNMQAFGPAWASYSQAQRQKITQGLIDANLYDSQKGDVNVTDIAAAQKIRDALLAGQATPSPAMQALQTPPQTQVLPASQIDPGFHLNEAISRSSTRSPGIDKNGNRINYGGR